MQNKVEISLLGSGYYIHMNVALRFEGLFQQLHHILAWVTTLLQLLPSLLKPRDEDQGFIELFLYRKNM